MKKISILKILTFITLFLVSYETANTRLTRQLTSDKLQFLPVSKDYRSYFCFQSINDDSYIIMSDFTGPERVIIQVIDRNSDNKINRVVEYFPDNKEFQTGRKPSSSKFTNLEKMKRDIISGGIFRKNYSYKMKSYGDIKTRVGNEKNTSRCNFGYCLLLYDKDEPGSITSEFFFGKRHGRYHLIFKTNYYRLFNIRIYPAIKYSVYCINSKDAIVAETVEALLELAKKE